MSPKIFAIANLLLSFVFNDFHTILVFTVNWDCSKLLLICRDFESNLGPLLVDKNPGFFCVIYSAKTKRVFQQITAPSCSETDCPVRYYQIYYQTRHTKSFGYILQRKWPQHGIAIAEIIAPPQPVILQPTRVFATVKSFNCQTNPIKPSNRSAIKLIPSSIILEDLNEQYSLWDPLQHPDPWWLNFGPDSQ